MYPGRYAAQAPDRVAAVMTGTGESLSYAELECRSVQLAHVLHDAGLRPGDVVALLTENSLRAFEVYWAALRSGLYITAVNFRLKPDEVAYIVKDCGRDRRGDHGTDREGRTAARVRRPGHRSRQLRGDHRRGVGRSVR
jgi:acyl-CoA synthetase (AMP-forming)/AMP-acid ligase II